MSNNSKINLFSIMNKEKHYIYHLNDLELKDLANSLCIPNVHNLSFEFLIHKEEDYYSIKGTLQSNIEQLCSITGEELQVQFEIDIFRKYRVANSGKYQDNIKDNKKEKNYIFLTKSLSKLEDEDIDILENYTLNVLDIIQEELLLNIDPYIKKTI